MDENLKKLMENKALLEGLVDVQTPDDLAKLLAENNIELEEGLSMEKAFELVKKGQTDELTEEDVENVNGGIVLSIAIGAVGAFVLASAALCFIGGYAYQTVKNARR